MRRSLLVSLVAFAMFLSLPAAAENGEPEAAPDPDGTALFDDTEDGEGFEALEAPPPPPVFDDRETASTPQETPRPLGATRDAAAGEKAFQEGFALLLEDRYAEAATALRQAHRLLEDPERIAAAAALLELADARAAGSVPPVQQIVEDALRDGRFPFVLYSTLAGISTGIKLSILLDFHDARGVAATIMGTTGLGLGLSLMATREGTLTRGEASLFRTGLIVGSYGTLHIARIAGTDFQSAVGLMLVGSLAGGAGGFFGARLTEMSPGDAALVGSTTFWGSITGLLMLPVLQPRAEEAFSGIMLGGTLAGLAGGLLATSFVDLSQTRVLLLDLGAVVGGVALGGLGLIVFFDDFRVADRAIPLMTIAGIIGGGAASLYLTRDLDVPTASAPGALLQLEDGQWKAGQPLPMPFVDTERGTAGAWLPLVGGRL
jgi:hypothetical protein